MTEYVRITDRKIELTDEGVEALVSDYTPTTEEVRYKYSWWTDKNLVARGVEPTDTKAEFDRWLEDVKIQERLRIFNELNRVTLVDDDRGGIQYERHNIIVDHSIQDNGHTLKLFVKENV